MTPRTRLILGLLVVSVALLTIVPGVTRPASAAPFTFYSATESNVPWRSAAGGTWLAQSFVAPAEAATVTQIAVRIRNAAEANNSSAAGSYSVSVWSNVSGAPGVNLAAAVTNRAIGPWGEENETFTLGTPLALTPGNSYFLVVTGSAGGTIGWKCPSTSTTGVNPAPTFVSLRSTDGGSSWSAVDGACAGKTFNAVVTGTVSVAATLSNFGPITATLGDAPLSITAPTANTAGTFTYSSSDSSVATVSGSQITVVGAGTATITATFTPTDIANFAVTTISTTLTVTTPSPVTTTSTTSTTTTTTTTSPTTTTTTTTTTPRTPTTVRPTTVAPQTTATSSTQDIVRPVVPVVSTTSTTPATTTSSTTTLPAPAFSSDGGSNDLFDDDQPMSMTLNAVPGDPIASVTISLEIRNLAPGTPFSVTVFSEPRELLRATVPQSGQFAATLVVPSDLPPGSHTVVAEASSVPVTMHVVGAFAIDGDQRIVAVSQPSPLTEFTTPGDARLERGLALDRPVYDPAAHPMTTSSIVVAAASLLAIAGAAGAARSTGGWSASGSGDEKQRRNSRGRLANAVTKKLKGLGTDGDAAGDASRTWHAPWTSTTDRFSVVAPTVTGRWSAVIPRILVDGAWLRAIFGSIGYAPWVVGAALGVAAAAGESATPLIPATTILMAIMALGVLDAGAGASAWLALTLTHLLVGETIESDVAGWADLRTTLGFGVLLATVPLLAHVIRPLRRPFQGSRTEAWERVLDYAIMPVFLAFAAGSMLKALNGLSGIEIVSTSDVTTLRLVVFATIMCRLAAEDLAAVLYPHRMREVQPAKLVSPGKIPTTVGIVTRSVLFLVVAEPFFGITAVTVTAAVLLAAPQILKMWEDELPNLAALHKWLPRGLTRFLCLLILGAWLTSTLVRGSADPRVLESAFIWLLLPGVAVGVAELFARHGGDWPNTTMKRALGVPVWLAAAGIVTGQLVLFG